MQGILFIFILSFILQVFFYGYFFRRLAFYSVSKKQMEKDLPVSILICAKNEEENLKALLPGIYNQDYTNFEVVLIDDRSTDHTWDVMDEFRAQFPHKTRVVRVDFSDNPRFIGNKKYALTLGIKAAKYNHLLFTDADCRPASKLWVKKMMSGFEKNKEIVLGYGKYKHKPGFLNKLIRFETLQTAMQYFSYALAGMPYMGVGRNLAYTKDLFFSNNGFYNHMEVLSGDDDLFINQTANKDNTRICIEEGAETISGPKTTWAEWISQKRRHISTAGYYKTKHKILLALYYLSTVLFYFSAFFLLIKKQYIMVILSILLVRFLMVLFMQWRVMNKLREPNLIIYFPLLEIGLIFIQFYIFILNLIRKPKAWTP